MVLGCSNCCEPANREVAAPGLQAALVGRWYTNCPNDSGAACLVDETQLGFAFLTHPR